MRHPDDPDITPASKASAALCLGVLGAVTGVTIGGLVPATIALVLAREAAVDIHGAQGWLEGQRQVVWARRMAWIGIGTALCVLVLMTAIWLLTGVGPRPLDFPSTVD